MPARSDSILPLRILSILVVLGFAAIMYLKSRPPKTEVEPEPGPVLVVAEADVAASEPVVEQQPAATPAPTPAPGPPSMSASRVKLEKKPDGSWSLLRNGKPYFVKGVGGDKYFKEAAELGANSVRTWGVGADTRGLLDRAHAQGLSVTFGHWLGHKRHGFQVHNEGAVKQQIAEVVANTKRYKDHPALLFWGVGNEVETGQAGDPKVWQVINETAKAIKAVDPHHPTMIVIAELGANDSHVKSIARYCPDIDIVGLNAYGGADSVVARYLAHHIGKPCLVTEYGPTLTKRDSLGRVEEPTSTEKAGIYAHIHRRGIAAHPGRCFGGYSFVWGTKTEMTDTYFGQFLKGGERLAQAEIFHELFDAPAPANRCPIVSPLEVTPAGRVATLGDDIRFRFPATDPDGDALSWRWEVKKELRGTVGGDHLVSNPPIAGAIHKASPSSPEAVIRPAQSGTYRVYAYVYDARGHAGTASASILIKPVEDLQAAKPLGLPLVIYRDGTLESPYVPSGSMGERNGEIRMAYDHRDRPHRGSSCMRVSAPAQAWSGMNWQHPPNDWGERAGGFDLSGAKKLHFWARGKAGGETVLFTVGGIGPEARYPDSLKVDHKVKLTSEWQEVVIHLAGQDLSRVKTPFHWSLTTGASAVEFFLDEIVID